MMNCHVIICINVCNWFTHLQQTICHNDDPFLQCKCCTPSNNKQWSETIKEVRNAVRKSEAVTVMEETCTTDINLPEGGIVSEDVTVINVKDCCNVHFELQDNTPGLTNR